MKKQSQPKAGILRQEIGVAELPEQITSGKALVMTHITIPQDANPIGRKLEKKK